MITHPTAALFDIGNVLVHLDFETPLAALVPPSMKNPKERIHRLLEKKDELESGAIAKDEFITWASERLGFPGSPESFLEAWNSIFEPIHSMWTMAAFLKSLGVKIILFSNTNCMHAEWLLKNYNVFEEFDERVFSHLVGAIKPDAAIYHHAIAQHDLVPADTLYIDDLPENIAKGEELGFRCHQYAFARHHQFIAWLDTQFGVPGPSSSADS
ncbi:MAG: HAD family phosphatase [Akkermansiaceae bacterium]|jgi:putative hydrolase of the HAD superfamily|nr:HAD family phosphatase [Roseibacillus sp.]